MLLWRSITTKNMHRARPSFPYWWVLMSEVLPHEVNCLCPFETQTDFWWNCGWVGACVCVCMCECVRDGGREMEWETREGGERERERWWWWCLTSLDESTLTCLYFLAGDFSRFRPWDCQSILWLIPASLQAAWWSHAPSGFGSTTARKEQQWHHELHAKWPDIIF